MKRNLKQVLVIRHDLKMRKGKSVAQGAHASLLAFLQSNKYDNEDWFRTGQTKICVRVESEEELMDIHQQCLEAGIVASLVRDKGLTEFKEPTYTAVGIGPADASDIDKITGELKLL